jgi:Zn-dependent M28 family amino/carboxypeptidase
MQQREFVFQIVEVPLLTLILHSYIDSVVNNIITKNVVFQTIEGDPDNCVMLGAHSDSVSAGPGNNDDGTGTLSLIEVAIQLTKFRVNNCVRFAWWSAEEEGLLGSDYYASQLSTEENLKVRLFMVRKHRMTYLSPSAASASRGPLEIATVF